MECGIGGRKGGGKRKRAPGGGGGRKAGGALAGKGGAFPRKLTRGAAGRAPKPFALELEEAQLGALPAHVPSFLTAAAAPSRYPPMKICSVSGLEGKYFDRARKARYASAKEYRTLQDIPTAALKAHKGQI